MITVYNDSDAAYPFKVSSTTSPSQKPFSSNHIFPQNIMQIFARQLHIHGFLVGGLRAKYEEEFLATVPAWIAKGEIRYREEVTQGLENAGHVLLDVQKGRNKAKSIVLVSKDEESGSVGLRSNL
jgi:NADPH-dependent curcumin reductase CurA